MWLVYATKYNADVDHLKYLPLRSGAFRENDSVSDQIFWLIMKTVCEKWGRLIKYRYSETKERWRCLCFRLNLCNASTVPLCLIKSNSKPSPVCFREPFVWLHAYVIEWKAELMIFQFTIRPGQKMSCI